MKFDTSNLNYSFNDFIGVFENAFTKEECENVIKSFQEFDKNKLTYTRSNKLFSDDSSVDINYLIELEMDFGFCSIFMERFYELLYPIYSKKYPSLENLPRHMPRYMKVQKTIPTQGYHTWHSEYSSSNSSRDRVLSWILYLNDIHYGGETEFLYQSLRVNPKMGTLILFPAYFTHTHRGNPPLREEKYIATGWVDFLNINEPQGKFEIKIPKINEHEIKEKSPLKKSISVNYL